MANDSNSIELATELTIAWLGNQNTRVHADDVPAFLQSMHEAVSRLSTSAAAESEAAPAEPEGKAEPAVSVRKSLASPDYIISMIDGKPYKTLRRHLSRHGLTPDQYRQRYGLKADYPMVAPTYSEHRRSMAHKIGLGRKGLRAVEAVENAVAGVTAAAAPAPAKRGRKSPADAKKAAQDHLGGE